ncbi:MAG TPA: hypothetical protein VF950_23940 [Planctomycetota bacterium]
MDEDRRPGPFSEDLELRVVSGPPKYTSRTDKPVEHITLADARDVVIGYIYANDDDDAAGWVARAEADSEAWNLAARWARMLMDAKRRGLKPSGALDEMIRAGSDARSHVVPGSRRTAAGLAALRKLATAT